MQAQQQDKPNMDFLTAARTLTIRAHIARRVKRYSVDAVLDRIDGIWLFYMYAASTAADAQKIVDKYLADHAAEFPEVVA